MKHLRIPSIIFISFFIYRFASAELSLESLEVYQNHSEQQEQLKKYWTALRDLNTGSVNAGAQLALMMIYEGIEHTLLDSGINESELQSLREARQSVDQFENAKLRITRETVEQIEVAKLEKARRSDGLFSAIDRQNNNPMVDVYPALENYLLQFPEIESLIDRLEAPLSLSPQAKLAYQKLVLCILGMAQLNQDLAPPQRIAVIQKMFVHAFVQYTLDFRWKFRGNRPELAFQNIEELFRSLGFPSDSAQMKKLLKTFNDENWVRSQLKTSLLATWKSVSNWWGFLSLFAALGAFSFLDQRGPLAPILAVSGSIAFAVIYANHYKDILYGGTDPRLYRAWKQSSKFLKSWQKKSKASCPKILSSLSAEVSS